MNTSDVLLASIGSASSAPSSTLASSTGCGSGNCGCGGGGSGAGGAEKPPATAPASVNGITIQAAGEELSEQDLRERAWAELLRQEAVRRELLPRHADLEAPALSIGDQRVIETMLDTAVQVPSPSAEECHRYYEARKEQFVEGRLVHARHILFAVTSGVDVHALSRRAEQALIELTRSADTARFAQLAAELSNCPSGAEGGDLGWFASHDCAEELTKELFHYKDATHGLGLHPRLVHSRYGFHIIEVLDRKDGRQLRFDEVQDRISTQLAQQARARALHQFMQLLAGAALVEGVSLDGADTPLVQ